MIRVDRVRLDGLIHQWEEQARFSGQYAVTFARTKAHEHHAAAAQAMTLQQCAEQLRAALLVLGDARPHPQEP